MQLAKLIGDIATGQIEDPMPEPSKDEIRRVMSALGRIGGPRGGRARAESLSKKRRKEIAEAAAAARWSKKKHD
jgi:hypothetical protein